MQTHSLKLIRWTLKIKSKQKMLNFVLTLEESWRLKNAPQIFSKYLTDKICKIKQYLNHINWWNNSKYYSSSKEVLKSTKNIWKTLHQEHNFQNSNYWIFLQSCKQKGKYLMKTLIFVRAETSLNEIMKSINPQKEKKIISR